MRASTRPPVDTSVIQNKRLPRHGHLGHHANLRNAFCLWTVVQTETRQRAEETTMRRRERYSMQITCPQCGKTGRVVWAESQAPAMKLVSSGFHTGLGTDRVENRIV